MRKEKRDSPPRGRLLVDWCTYAALGHVIEGLHVAGAHAAADQDTDVSLLLNSRSAVELADCCPWLTSTYQIDLMTFSRKPYEHVPAEWDWVVEVPHRRDRTQVAAFPKFRLLAAAADAHYVRTRSEAPPRVPGYQLRLTVPDPARERARRLAPGELVFTVMLSGGGEREKYPSTGSWHLLLGELRRAWPDATIVLLGKSDATGGGSSSAMKRDEIDQLLAAVDAVDGYDLPLLVQLALVERSAFLFSPHTGFGFTASTVGTPWLTLSGGPWFEYFHNGVPFHSLIPDTGKYLCFLGMHGPVLVEDDDGSGKRDASMTRARVVETVPELLTAADALIHGRRGYEECLQEYFPRLLAAMDGHRECMSSWDDIHERYL